MRTKHTVGRTKIYACGDNVSPFKNPRIDERLGRLKQEKELGHKLQEAYGIAPRSVTAIHDSETHRHMLSCIEDLWDSDPGTPEHDELEVLSILIDDYENEQFPI